MRKRIEKSNQPFVSIGFCVKNSQETVGEALGSIMRSNYPHCKMELIVVDGMSKDRTLEIIRETFKDTDIKAILLSDKGNGLGYARQLAVDNASGKYIIWIDGDNTIQPDFVRSHVTFMETTPSVGVACPRFLPKARSLVAKLQGYQWSIHTFQRTDKGYFVGKMGAQGTICRRSAIGDVGGFDLSIKGAGEDVDLFIRIKNRRWKIARNDEAVISHFMRDNWASLWKESCWWGYGTYNLATKHKNCFPRFRRRVGLTMLECVMLTIKSIIATRDIACLLMPVHYLFRRLGFLSGHLRAYLDQHHQ